MSDVIPAEKVSSDAVEAIFKQAYIPTERDKDGDVVIREGGVNTIVMVNQAKRILAFISLWGLNPEASELDRLRLVNDLNDDLIMVRFSVRRPDTLLCDFQMPYDGGITPFQVVSIYRRFNTVCEGAALRAPDGMIG